VAELLGVELARPGTWQLSNGAREFTAGMLRDAADFHAAAGGQRIPLGFGHRDSRFDGEPAFGWLTNVRYDEDDNGPVLLGDLTDLDEWVHAAAPARWPHRSVEGVMGVKFQGREYGLVLTRLALLGSTPPGIPALKSLSDLRQLVSAAAAESGAEWIAAEPDAASPETSPHGVDNPSDRKGAPGMPDAAKLRDALGLGPDVSDDEVKTALASAGFVASQPEPTPAPNPVPQPEPAPPAPAADRQLVSAAAAPPPGVMTIAASVWDETQNTIKRLSSFVDETKRSERDSVIASAVEAGKFYPSQKKQFADLWDSNPDGTRALIDGLTPNSALAVAASGYSDEMDGQDLDREFAGIFPAGYLSNNKGA
jgi:Mu-like prophage I protein